MSEMLEQLENDPQSASTAPTDTPKEVSQSTQSSNEAPLQTEEPQSQDKNTLRTLASFVEEVEQMLQEENIPPRAQMESLSRTFDRVVHQYKEKEQADFLSQGGVLEDFMPPIYPEEISFKEYYNQLKQKRAQFLEQEKITKEANYQAKQEILKQLTALCEEEGVEDFKAQFEQFKQLQQQWNSIKNIPDDKIKEVRDAYKLQTEKFYDLVRINNELRDYDFKKNLELKNSLIDAAKRLLEEEDVVSALHQIQALRAEWYDIGPVAKEYRDEIWNTFKEIVSEIGKKHQAHFEQIRNQENENLAQKTALCEKIESINLDAIVTMKEWEQYTNEILELQAQWKTIGFAPKKVNNAIYERFRETCNKFFTKKSQASKEFRRELAQNLAKKQELCKAAEELKESTNWREASNKVMELQKEWKTIGQVPRKHSDQLWNQFVSACNYVFEQRKGVDSSQREEEKANAKKKKELIEQINNLATSLSVDQAYAQLKEFAQQWNSIGFVPYKQKDAIQSAYQSAMDSQFDRLRIEKDERQIVKFQSQIEDSSPADLRQEKIRLNRQYDRIKNEVQTYENNLSFFSASSKGGSGLLKDVQNKVERLKHQLEVIQQKISTINQLLSQNN